MRRIALVVVLAACGGEKQKAPDVVAKVDAAVAAADVAEVVHTRYYRAPGGTAAFRYPELDAAWTSSLERGASPTITFTTRDAKIQLWFPPRADQPLVAEQVAREAVTMLGGDVVESRAMGPNGYLLRVAGGAVLATVDGDASAIVIAMASDATTKQPAFASAYEAILEGVQVGSQQPKAPPASPGTPLDAVFIHARSDGGYDAYVFDPRGYVHADDDVAGDLDAIWALRDGKLDPYTFDGAKLTFGKHAGTLAGNELTLDGERYCRATGRVPARLDGHWALVGGGTTSTNAYDTFHATVHDDVFFAKDGTYGFTSRVDASRSDTPGSPTRTPGVLASAEAGDHGTYDLADDRLTLHAADGTTEVRTIYAAGCDADADDRTGVLYVSGSIYLRVTTDAR